ncbi:ABC transporter permease [Conexibacter stalactiti]|uniref:ABC transporter permease n=1 Tax=Conexibacter stalactiti TaxID=1940611 RepID=A0ABU4HI35_9ACTN|nr:ABC transporter permease [Conexibacter stalactiti]MDW5592971.1 ABC transporter permease [Conexibacter stalactiti]MEC5033612.1 ABC transporter permease [Conexibacter stalactiti]
MRPDSLLRYLRWRLTGFWPHDLLAGAGIAAGVALIFAVIVSNSSITAGAREILTGIAGDSQLQMTARTTDGVDERIVAAVRETPGVATAAPLLEQRVTLAHGDRRVGVELVGMDRSLGNLNGIASTPLLVGLISLPQLLLPSVVAEQLDLPAGASARDSRLVVEARGLAWPTTVSDVVGEAVIGPLAAGNIAGAPLDRAQIWAGLPGRVTRVLVKTAPGQEEAVRQRLQQLAGETMDIGTLDDELALLRQASLPNDQATSLFAGIGVLVGLLLAYTAVLLTIPERRRLVADCITDGTPRGKIAQIVLFPSLVLGLIAGAAGIALGLLLLHTSAHEPPGYLAFAWPLGRGQHVTSTTVIGALLAGVALSLIAGAQPLLDLRRSAVRLHDADEEPGQTIEPATRRRAAVVSAVLIALCLALAQTAPQLTILAVAGLVTAALLALPALFALTLTIIARWPRRDRPSAAAEAVRELRVTSLRSLALAATAAVAIFGVTAMEGAHRNLLHGLFEDYREFISSSPVWITQHGDDLAVQPINVNPAQLADVDGVAAVRTYQGGFADLGDRRVWVQARDPRDSVLIPPSQLLEGDLKTASDQLRAGGWVTVSRHVADQEHVGLGDSISLPTPSGSRSWRVAAITTNLGWGPGAIILNQRDYQRAWKTSTPTAIEVDPEPGVAPQQVVDAIKRELGATAAAALRVQTSQQRADDANAVARAGLQRLSQIALILLAAAALALAAALSTTIWQRRRTWAVRRFEAFRPTFALRIVLIEATVILGVGCVAGALAGTYGHWLLGRWLQLTTGYPAPFSLSIPSTVGTCAALILVALVLTAIPAERAIRPPARLAVNPHT